MKAPCGFVVLCAMGMVGCSSSPVSPYGDTPVPVPSVISISPAVGSTKGATMVTIKGDGLGRAVKFGDTTVVGPLGGRCPCATMVVYTPEHMAGTVVVAVSDLNGRTVATSQTFTYAAPDTFDFNGNWSGFGNNGQDSLIRFTIRDNRLLTASCDSVYVDQAGTDLTFTPPPPVTDSAFSYKGSDAIFTGRIVGPAMATGTIRLGECDSDGWYAQKQ